MDPVSGLKTDSFRPLVTVFIPGVVGIAPGIAHTVAAFPNLGDAIGKSPLLFGLLMLCAAVAAGMLFENFGGIVEMWIWNRLFPRSSEARRQKDAQWNAYLRCKTKDEAIGHRYLDSILVRFKFETAMLPALVCCGLQLVLANVRFCIVSPRELMIALLVIAAVFGYLLWEAFDSVKLMADVREQLVSGNDGNSPETRA